MADSRVQPPPINLKERIAAIEQLNVPPKSRPESPSPSGIPQLVSHSALRDKIAKFEKKGGVPVPRGRFGLGAPPAHSGKPKKNGELYGNRIPRAVSGGVPALVGTSRRSMSLSVQHYDYDSSSSVGSRSPSPCPSDYDGASDGILSPDSSKTGFSRTPDPTSPVHDSTEALLSPPFEASSDSGIPSSEEDTSEGVPQVVITLLSPVHDDTSNEVITSPHQPEDGEGNLFVDNVVSPTHDEQDEKEEGEPDLIMISPSLSQEDNDAVSSPMLEESRPSDIEIPAPSGESQSPRATPHSPNLEGESRRLSAVIPSPTDIQPVSATLPSPKLEDTQPFSAASSSPEDEQPLSATLSSPVPKGALPFSATLPSSPVPQGTLPFSPTVPSPVLQGAVPFDSTLPSPVPKGSLPFSATLPSPEPKATLPFSVTLPSPVPKGALPLSPTLSSPGLADTSPISAAFSSPGPNALSPISTILSPNLEEGIGSLSPVVPSPTSPGVPSPKLEDVEQLRTAISSPRSANSDKLFSPTISSPRSEVLPSPDAAFSSPGSEPDIQPLEPTIPSPGLKEKVQSPRLIAKSENEKRQSACNVALPPSPGAMDASQPVNDTIAQSSEAQDTETPSISRSSSLRTLTPTSHDPPSIIVAGEEPEQATKPTIPVISLSPPATDGTPSPLAFTPSQENERITSPISAGTSPASSNSRSPSETRSRTVSPVESTRSNSSNARPTIWRHSSADERLSNVTSPASGTSEGSFIYSPGSGDLHDPSLADQLSDQILSMLLEKDSSSGPSVTLTSSSQTPGSPFAQLAYDGHDRRATMPSPSYFAQSGLALADTLSPSAPADMTSPLSSGGVISPGEIVTAQRVGTATVRGVPLFLPRREVDYSHFPPTPDVTNTDFRGSLPSTALSPTSPSSRFKNPPSAFPGRSNTFNAVVHGKVKDSAMPSFGSLLNTPEARKARQSKAFDPFSPSNGELATLLQDAALLEDALTQGALPGESRASEDVSESGKQLEEQDVEEDPRRLRRHATLIQPAPGKDGLFKTSATFRLAMRKKTKHWKATSTNIPLADDLQSRPSLEAERRAGLSIPDPAFLQKDPAESNRDKNLPKTPAEPSDSASKSPRPRIVSGIKRLAGTGSTRSLYMPSAYSRHSASTSSEQSSEDSMPVVTPPDPSNDYPQLGQGTSNVAWPSVSPKRSTIRRATSFAEKLWNRARTRSASSTLSANESKASGSQQDIMPSKTSGSSFVAISSSLSSEDLPSSRSSSRATYKLDLVPPSEPLFDEEDDMLSPSTLPNPYSPGSSNVGSPSSNVLSPSSVLSNPHSLGSSEAWTSDPPHIHAELVNSFPSVPQAVLSTQTSSKATQPLPSINVAGVFDPFFSNPAGAQSATIPKRNITMSHLPAAPRTAGVTGDGTFLGRASTMPRQRPL